MTTKNEIQTIENNGVSVSYRQAELAINDLDELKKRVAKVTETYKNRVYEAGDEKALKADRSELKAIRDALDDARKNIKRQYSRPLNTFESEIKSLTKQIDEPLENIRSNLKEIDEKKRDTNRHTVLEFIKENAELYSIEPEDVEFKESWTNASGFTEKLNMKKRLKDDVLVEIQNVSMQKQREFQDEQTLRKYCEEKGIDPKGWVDQLKYESLSEIMTKVDRAATPKQKPESQLTPEPMQEPTDEVKNEPNQEQQSPAQPTTQLATRIIEITGEKKLVETVIAYAKELGLRVIEPELQVYTVDDLPWD